MTNQSKFEPPLLVRLDAETRRTLAEIAATTDRTMSQLVRYATNWWTADSSRVCPPAPTGTETTDGKYVNVRFTADDMALIRSIAAEMGTERASVIRCALRSWLTLGDHTTLGSRPEPLATTSAR